ncbi:MAG: hypothetical protein BGO68_06115 [Candidatus Amoebophilus sp. 36-38]|nr:MAG: hypothetical protein BGO68_06115 [Candidatus Amoebophilus sp. 36-38]
MLLTGMPRFLVIPHIQPKLAFRFVNNKIVVVVVITAPSESLEKDSEGKKVQNDNFIRVP